jgi:hypothetical protein
MEVYVFFDKKFRVTSSPKWLPIRVVSALRLLLKFFGDKSPELVSKLGIFAGEKSDFTHLDTKDFGRAWYVDSYFTGLGDKKVFGKYLDEVTHSIESLITKEASECNFAVHIRMGDYLKIDPALIPSPSRYKIAIEDLIEKGFKTLVIFSDQPSEALDMVRKMNLGIQIEVAKEDLSGIKLLASLASFKAIVCSSSTLSWWAARVIDRRQGAVYFPNPEIKGIPNLVLPKSWMLF